MDGKPEERKALTGKQEAFVRWYCGAARFNATEAARQAGYKDPELSGWENRQNPVIRARIDERLAAEALSPSEVLRELSDVAASEWRDHLEIQTNKYGKTTRVKMDLSSKVKALELLGKGHQLWTDKIQHGGEVLIRGYGAVPVDDV